MLLRGAVGRGAPQATAPALDAAELVGAALDALASDPELLTAERARVRHLLVDDAQDLDPQQMELVRCWAHGPHRRARGRPGPGRARLPRRGPVGPRTPWTRPSWCSVWTVVPDRRSGPPPPGLAARLSGTGPGRTRVGPAEPPDDPLAEADGRSTCACSARRRRKRPGSRTGCGARTCSTACPGRRWRCCHAPPGARSRCCAARLLAAGVPIAVPPDGLPLARQPAVVPLLMVFRYAARPGRPRRRRRHRAAHLPLGSADPLRLRRLRAGCCALHAAGGQARGSACGAAGTTRRAVVGRTGRPSPGSAPAPVVGAVLSTPRRTRSASAATRSSWTRCAPPPGAAGSAGRAPPVETAPLRRVGALLHVAGAAIREGAGAEQVLWRIWQATNLEHGGSRPPRSAARWVRRRTATSTPSSRSSTAPPARRPAARRGRLRIRGVPRRPAAAVPTPSPPGRPTRTPSRCSLHTPRAAGSGGSWPCPASRRGLAGPAAAGEPLGQRAAGRPRRRGGRARCRGVADRAAARGGAAVVLRRVHARAGDVAGQCGAGGQRLGGRRRSSDPGVLDELDPAPDDGRDRADRPGAPARSRPGARGAGRRAAARRVQPGRARRGPGRARGA